MSQGPPTSKSHNLMRTPRSGESSLLDMCYSPFAVSFDLILWQFLFFDHVHLS